MLVKSVTLTQPDRNAENIDDVQKVLSAIIVLNDGTVKTLSIFDSTPGFKSALSTVIKFQRKEVTEDELANALIIAADKTSHIEERFKSLGILDGRLVRKGNRILVDYEPIDPVLEAHIIRILDNGDKDNEWVALSKFIENLYSNTLDYVRNQLFGWLKACTDGAEKGFTITEDGCFIGYKGCYRDSNNVPRSINSGFGIVNGKEENGNLDNSIGNVVEMPRNMVENNPKVGCSKGLHVGTWDYASGFSQGVILTVKVNPRDVVSIPEDCNFQKLRCCRYEVIDVTDAPISQSTYGIDADDTSDDYDDDYNYDCGPDCCDDYCDCGDCEMCDPESDF